MGGWRCDVFCVRFCCGLLLLTWSVCCAYCCRVAEWVLVLSLAELGYTVSQDVILGDFDFLCQRVLRFFYCLSGFAVLQYNIYE